MINIVDNKIDYFIDRLENKRYFSYSRFNDGELICAIKQVKGSPPIDQDSNCDKHKYFPKMGEELLKTLNRSNCEDYFIQYLSGWNNDDKFKKHNDLLIRDSLIMGTYQQTDFLQLALRYQPESFKRIVNTLNQYKIMIVGPKYLKDIKFLNVTNFIEVPSVNCYLKKDEVLQEIKEHLTTDYVVLFSASMATNVLIDELHDQYKDTNFLIDAGSVWDIFFKDKNPKIRQRTPNNNNYKKYKEVYKEYFL